jgi:hypothetical protein
MRIFIFSLCIGIAFIALASCERNQVTTVICFIDLSSRDSATIEWYKETFKAQVLRNMPSNSRLVVLPIDYFSQSGSTEIITVDFSKNQYGNEYSGLQSAEIEAQNHQDSVSVAIQAFDREFQRERNHRLLLSEGTDLFGALAQARKYAVPGQRTIIVLLSDMMEYSDKRQMNFEASLNSADEIEHYLGKAEKVDLEGMEIVVLTGLHRTMQPEKYQVLKAFWEKYFAQCKGKLIDYSSGAVSKLQEVLMGKANP